MEDSKPLMDGMTMYGNQNTFKVIRLHYSADEEKDRAWVKHTKASYPYDELWQQEMELDFISTAGRRVYPEFSIERNVTQLQHDPYVPIWRGWDFGYHHPVCVWGQRTSQGRLNVLHEYFAEDMVIEKFADDVKRMSRELFSGQKFFDAGDPACRQKTDKTERTTADILRSLGIRLQSRPSAIEDGIHLIRALMLPRPDGFVRFKISDCCKMSIDGFLGGYVRNEREDPVKDGFYDHLMDAIRYMCVILFDIRTANAAKPRHAFVRSRPTADVVTGY